MAKYKKKSYISSTKISLCLCLYRFSPLLSPLSVGLAHFPMTTSDSCEQPKNITRVCGSLARKCSAQIQKKWGMNGVWSATLSTKICTIASHITHFWVSLSIVSGTLLSFYGVYLVLEFVAILLFKHFVHRPSPITSSMGNVDILRCWDQS